MRSVVDRLAAHAHPALALLLFARAAPDLETVRSGSRPASQGRHHLGSDPPGCCRSCRLASAPTRGSAIRGVAAAFDCCGAGVSRMRPGGGEPSLALLPQVQARLTYVFGTADPLVPADDRAAIQAALL